MDKLIHSVDASRHEADAGEHLHGVLGGAARGPRLGLSAADAQRRYVKIGGQRTIQVDGRRLPVHLAVAPGGRRVPLLKAMLTTACERNCLYCAFRAGRDHQRVRFQPQELAEIYMKLHRSGQIQGLFLSSGLADGGLRTQDQLTDTAIILRRRHGYSGYLHLKIMPGAQQEHVVQAMLLADRVSINLEAPNAPCLARMAPWKKFDEELMQPLRWMEAIRRSSEPHRATHGRWASSTTQFVVGPAGESDLELLSITTRLHRSLGLSRAYFEAFNPVPDTPLESHPPESPLRQHRLYQASFLLRDYGFDLEDLPFSADGRLPLDADPKLAYARAALRGAPVEINQAAREQLLRVPGIGPRSADEILRLRSLSPLQSLGVLRRLGVLAERAAPYITLAGRQPPQQFKLWPSMEHPGQDQPRCPEPRNDHLGCDIPR